MHWQPDYLEVHLRNVLKGKVTRVHTTQAGCLFLENRELLQDIRRSLSGVMNWCIPLSPMIENANLLERHSI